MTECAFFAAEVVLELDRFGGGGVMVRGEILISDRKTDLIVFPGILNVQRYIKEVLRPETKNN